MRGLVIFLIGSSTLIGACSKQNAESPEAPRAPLLVQTSVAKIQELQEFVVAPGTVSRAQHAKLASPYGGLVTAAPVTAGSRVHRGELLLSVGTADALARLASAKAQQTSSRAEAQQSASDELRYKALLSEGAVAPREYEQVHQRNLTAGAQVQAAEQSVVAAKSNLNYAELRAPFDGLLVERPVELGDYAAPGTVVAVIIGGAAEVTLQVGDALYSRLPLQARIEVTVDERAYPANVVERVDAMDSVTRTHRVKLRVESTDAPAFGGYAVAQVPTGTRQAVMIPTAAVVERAGLAGTFVIDAQGQAQFRPLRVAPGGSAGMTAIASGLQAGERVVLAPPLAIGNGSAVRSDSKVPASD
jgi:RND family efflux transporter MFP subunit